MHKVVLSAALLCLVTPPLAGSKAASDSPRLYPQISLSRTQIVFAHAGDIWAVSRSGGAAVQLTRGLEDDGHPAFSPDGSGLAFTRTVNGQSDVYVMPAAGGAPRRLTFDPAADLVRGWSRDGRDVLFSSPRVLPSQTNLYTVAAAGGPNKRLPIARAVTGVFLPDGRMVFAPREVFGRTGISWRGYRGGTTAMLMVTDLSGKTFKPVTTGEANDRFPTLAGEILLIASDRAGGILNVHKLDPHTGQAEPVTRFSDVGIEALTAAPDGMAAYVRDGHIYLLDPRSGRSRPVPVALQSDSWEMAKREVRATDYVGSPAVDRQGHTAIPGRGDILLLPAQGGGFRRLTATSGAVDDQPSFSPDGARLAWVSSDSRGDRLVVQKLGVAGLARSIALPQGRAGWGDLAWAPDGTGIAITDSRAGLWIADLGSGAVRKVDQGLHMLDFTFDAAWAPDGKKLAYARYLPNHNRALFLYDTRASQSIALTEGETDAGSPVFDSSGTKLYFRASGNAGISEAFGMSSSILRPLLMRTLQVADLAGSPSAAEFRQAVRPLGAEAKDYQTIRLMADGDLLVSALQWPPSPAGGEPETTLFRVNPKTGETVRVAGEIEEFALSASGERALVKSGGTWSIISIDGRTQPRALALDTAMLLVDPPTEWRHIYHEAWRAMDNAFYDPAHHGQDLRALERRYARYLPSITRRSDLTELLYRALGNVSVSHIALSGGDMGGKADAPQSSGLIGADFTVENGRYRFAKVLAGDPYGAKAALGPLHGSGVREGDYLIAVDQVEVLAEKDLQFYLLGSGGKEVRLTVARRSDGQGSREVRVTPLASDAALREAAWVTENRRTVEERSKGKLGYVYITDYQEAGAAGFIRQWSAASDRDGVLLDQRFNPGGWAADFVLDMVRRKPLSYYAFRDAKPLPFPVISNSGPVGLLINHRNGSASDTFPWLFRRAGVGPLIGTKTGGAGVGHIYSTGFIDGGSLSLPLRAFFNPEGSWDIENEGVSPDLVVEEDQARLLQGEDIQLEAAVDLLLRLQARTPKAEPKLPPPMLYPPQPKLEPQSSASSSRLPASVTRRPKK